LEFGIGIYDCFRLDELYFILNEFHTAQKYAGIPLKLNLSTIATRHSYAI